MPKIYKLELSLSPEIRPAGRIIRERRCKRKPGKQIMMFGCQCFHMEHNHFEGKFCVYNPEFCDCERFVPLMLDFVVEITNADIFEFEIKDHSERDSFQYYNELSLWEKLRCE